MLATNRAATEAAPIMYTGITHMPGRSKTVEGRNIIHRSPQIEKEQNSVTVMVS
jgi:ABC-type phosphate transport system permease subunit